MKPQRAVIYCRISLDESGEGLGVARQEEFCRELCQRNGWQVVEVITDNSVSATARKKRPGWTRVLAKITAGEVDVVVAWQIDRMYRTIRDLEDLVDLTEDTGVTLATVSGDLNLTSANGRMMARILGSTARGEVEMKAERQKRAHAQRAKAGRPWWNARPFGFERDGEHRPEEAAALAQAYADVLGGKSVYAVAQQWNREGILTTKGNTWRSSNLRHVLMQPRNAAIATYNSVETGHPGNWEPVVSEEVYRAIVRLLSEPARHTGGDGKRKALLTGVAICSKCNARVVQGVSRRNKAGDRRRLYTCRERRCITIEADFLDSYVLRRVIDRVDEWVHLAADAFYTGEAEPGDNAEVAALRAQELTFRQQRQTAEDMVKSGVMDAAAFTATAERLGVLLSDIEQQLADAAIARSPVYDLLRNIARDTEYLWQEVDRWMEEDMDLVRSIVTAVTESITLLPRKRGAHRPSPKDVKIRFREPRQPSEKSNAAVVPLHREAG